MQRNQSVELSRRNLLVRSLQASAALLLGGCERVVNGLHQEPRWLALLESAEGLNRRFLRWLTPEGKLAQEFSEAEISRYFKPNGNPPPLTIDYVLGAMSGWSLWRLEVGGLVEEPQSLSLEALQAMPARTQITRHDCVEGWSAIAKWKGTPLHELMARVRPKPEARYAVFYCLDTDAEGNHYYESIDMRDARHPQTILAYEMNDRPLPIEHGAPVRLRVETQLGYKMAKYVQRIEFVADYKRIGRGKGGYWEDRGYEWYAGI
jgi:DMSO/TMAO reductase YedYZ molybdopterin-dependent catalytic subunit